jgi:hypothetical protein
MRTLRLKLIRLFCSVPNDDIKLRELLEEVRPHRAIYAVRLWRRGSIRGDEAREWLERRRNEAIAELTLTIATIVMLAVIVAPVRR